MGAALTQALHLAAIPFISRLFTPEHFGIVAFFLSYGTIFAAIGSLRYEQAIILPEDESQAAGLARLSGLILIGATAALGAAIVLLKALGQSELVLPSIADWSLLLPLVLLFLGGISLATSWRIRRKEFRAVASASVLGAAVAGATRIGLGAAFDSSVGALLLGTFAGYLASIGFLYRGSGLGSALRPDPRALPRTRELARAYRAFPSQATPTTLLNRLSQALPVLALAYLFPPASVGAYALTERALRAPLEVVTESVRRVFYQKGSELKHEGRSLRAPFVNLTLALLALGLISALALVAFGEPVFAWVFGQDWVTSGRFAAAIAPWFATGLAMPPTNVVFIVYKRQDLWLATQVALTTARIASIGASAYMGSDAIGTIATFSWVSAIGNLIIILFGFRVSRRLSGSEPS